MAKCDGKGKYKTVVIGDYVFTPIKNQFNDETAYWLSKRWYTYALYCFTVSDWSDYKMLEDSRVLDSYIKYFDSMTNSNESVEIYK